MAVTGFPSTRSSAARRRRRAVLFPPATVGLIMLPLMLFHQIQLFVCAVIASRLGRAAPQISSG
jgi:sodium/bile acid cotransporter 7